ncbi:hypothetical protein GCM10023194_35730 [Planotetraspora phitsanulokensis]|uniref:DUF2809 domain-containing protein n=1 Tax=Planotetraspora phitsanulokensis TaxID=575192 RepID=A0A8J3U5B0_9ACTN|nr:DUF2809 domain-containing protein [Planotetraspora phitsanulokensis]GII36299.1 hypothetical protein Pph01_13020 [Planotetraspora phitsanulokensis]
MSRFPVAVAAVVTIAAGLLIRAFLDGPFAKYAGDALYTVLLYLLVLLAVPAARPSRVAAISLAASWLIEFSQLLDLPAIARPILGSTFNPPDLLWYAVGAGAAWVIHAGVRRPVRARGPNGVQDGDHEGDGPAGEEPTSSPAGRDERN